MSELSDLCGPGGEFITRQNAMGALRRLGQVTPQAAGHMVAALLSTNNRLSAVASGIIATLCEQPKVKLVFRQIVDKQQLTPSQKVQLSSIFR
jgi:hypothetical protein